MTRLAGRGRRGQRGFSVIEMIAALAITGCIGLGAAVSSVQVLDQTAHNADYTTASRQALNAVQWLSLDVQMAQTMETSGEAGFPLTLTRLAWDNTVHQVIYDLSDGALVRYYYVDGEGPHQTRVAEYIDPDTALTHCEASGGVLSLTLTASVGRGEARTSVTKARQITSRPNL